jgi:hypothetical protein
MWLPIWPNKRTEMNELALAGRAADWRRLRTLVSIWSRHRCRERTAIKAADLERIKRRQPAAKRFNFFQCYW